MPQSKTAPKGAEDRMMEADRELQERLDRIRHKILVMSGKGGVGKSSVAAYLSVVLCHRGYRVGLMDVDLHGPSIPRMLGITGLMAAGDNQRAIPIRADRNLQVVSLENLLPDRDSAVIWRGPLKIGVIKQFIRDIEWDDLDFLVVDSPPGTGDEPLTIAQTISDAHALVVTTPQEISLADVRKSINFCRQVNLRMLGLLENMSVLICPHCGREVEVFPRGGGERTAHQAGIPFLGSLPMDPKVVEAADAGLTSFLADSAMPFSQAFQKLADQVEAGCGAVLPDGRPLSETAG